VRCGSTVCSNGWIYAVAGERWRRAPADLGSSHHRAQRMQICSIPGGATALRSTSVWSSVVRACMFSIKVSLPAGET
jgi:hypothetical protein